MPDSYIKRILDARVYDVAIESPIDEARRLSARLGNPPQPARFGIAECVAR